MEKNRRDEKIRKKKSRERVKMTEDIGKKKREQVESNGGEEVFCLWKI